MEAYEMLKPYIEYIHIKDNRKGVGVLPAGKGDGKIEEILRDLYKNGYDGYLSLEPHLFKYVIPEDASDLVKSFETDKQKTYAIAYESLVEVLDKIWYLKMMIFPYTASLFTLCVRDLFIKKQLTLLSFYSIIYNCR